MIAANGKDKANLLDVDFDAIMQGYPSELLSDEEEQRIGRLPSGHEDRWKLVTHNMNYMLKFAINFCKRHKGIIDGHAFIAALQDAMIVSAQNYDSSKSNGCRFVHFCKRKLHWTAMNESSRQNAPVKLPVWEQANKHLLREEGDYYVCLDGHKPEDHMDAFIANESASKPQENESIDERVENAQLRGDLEDSFKRIITSGKLDTRAINIIKRTFGFDGEKPVTCADLALELGVSKQRVRQIRERALRKMRCNKLRDHHKA